MRLHLHTSYPIPLIPKEIVVCGRDLDACSHFWQTTNETDYFSVLRIAIDTHSYYNTRIVYTIHDSTKEPNRGGKRACHYQVHSRTSSILSSDFCHGIAIRTTKTTTMTSSSCRRFRHPILSRSFSLCVLFCHLHTHTRRTYREEWR